MEKYFTEKQIYASTFFGGPIPPGILIYKNFKRIGDNRKANLTLLFTFLFTMVVFYGLMKLPEEISDKLPNVLFTAFYTGLVYLIYHKYIADKINDKIIEPENKASNWSVAGFTLIGLLITILIIIGFAISAPAFSGDVIKYGEMKHEIYFDKGEINESDIQFVGQVLTDLEYFNNEYIQAVRIENSDNNYTLKLPVQKDYWSDSGLLNDLSILKIDLKEKTGREFIIVLIDYDFSGNTFTKKI